MLNPDFAIIVNITATEGVDPDALVRHARDIGARAIASQQPDLFQAACEKYTIANLPSQDGRDYPVGQVVDALVAARQAGKPLVINFDPDSPEDQEALEELNLWMHKYGHAVNDGAPSELTANADGAFLLTNRHASYQDYLFVKKPFTDEIEVAGLDQEPNRVEWIDGRVDCPYTFEKKILKITLPIVESTFTWQVIRIQEHRPEDDIAETEF